MVLKELITKWGFKIDDSPLKRVEGHLGQIKQGVDFLIGTQVIKKFMDLEERFSKWAHELNSVSIASNVAVETIQKLTFAGAQFGATQEEITGAMTGMTLKINDAKLGIEGAQRAFAMAGFTGTQINSWKNGNDALMALADRMKATTDPIRRQAMAAQLGVSANSRLYAMLMQGSGALKEMAKEATELGTVMSDDQVSALVAAQNALSKLWMVFQGIGKTIASLFAPSLKSAVDSMLAFYKSIRKTLELNLQKWVYDITYVLGYLWGILKFMGKAVFDFAEAWPNLFRRITEVGGAVAVLMTALIGLGAILFPIIKALEALKIALTFIKSAFTVVVTLISWGTKIFSFLRWAVLSVTLAFEVLTAATFPVWASIAAGIAVVTGAIALLVTGVVSLWQHFVNGKDWKDTWIGKMLGGIKEFFSTLMSLKKIGRFFGMSGEDDEAPKPESKDLLKGVTNLDQVAAVTGLPDNMKGATQNNFSDFNTSTANSKSISSEDKMSINAPVTINVNGAGHSPMEIAKHVNNGIGEHLTSKIKQVHQSLKPKEQS